MQSQERVLKAINHEEPDRVPIDIGGMRSTGIHAIAYRKLRQHLGLDHKKVKLYDIWQQLAQIDEDILDYFDADVVPLNRLAPAFGIDIDQWKEGKLPDGSTCLVPRGFDPVKEEGVYKIKNDQGRTIARRSEVSLYYDTAGVYHPLSDATTTADIKEDYDWETISEKEKQHLKNQSKKLGNSNYAVLAEFGGSIYEKGQLLRGYKQWYLDVASNKDLVEYLLDLLVENYLENLETYIDLVGDDADIVFFGGDDLGMQDAPQISPQTYRELFKPRHKKMWNYIKANTNWRVFLHSCGSIYQLLPDLIDAGVDIINPVHINAAEMDPQRLEEEFGDQVVFWGGGCDTQKILPKGAPEEVKEEVKKNIDIFSPGGGYVFTPVHNIQPDVPVENIVKVYKTAREYGNQMYNES